MLYRVAVARTDVSEKRIASIIKVARFGEWGTTLALTICVFRLLVLLATAKVSTSPILVTRMMETICSSEISVLTRATRRSIPEEDIIHSHRCENLKSSIGLTDWTL
jgi:hypothetical protein